MTNTEKAPVINPTLRKVLILVFAGLVGTYVLGYFAGYLVGTIETGNFSTKAIVTLTGAFLILLSLAVGGWLLWPKTADEPVASSVKKSNSMMKASVAVGLALGVLFAFGMGGNPGEFAMFSNSPIEPWVAGIGIAVWLVLVPILTFRWMAAIDEHESVSYREGALFAGHAFVFITPAWWLGQRAGWLPAQEPMILFLIITTLWSVVWLYRRFA